MATSRKLVPGALASEEEREHGQVQVQVEHEPEAGDPVQRERPVAGAPLPDVEPGGRSRRLPQDRAARVARGPDVVEVVGGGPAHEPSPRRLVNARRRCMIRCAGRTLDGQASVHSNAAWHRHAALSRVGPVEDGADVAPSRLLQHPLGVREGGGPDVRVVGGRDRTGREAEAALDAVLEPLVRVDPRRNLGRLGELAATGRSGVCDGNRSKKEVMSTIRSARTGKFAMGSTVTRPCSRSARRRHAREPFAAVHPNPAGPARRVEARVPDGERLDRDGS